ncbi:MAG: hypothetical protein NT085_04790, partial [candidate division SR1 bacterium]|nr:hypothetical protein [candidate division SR1 bacterium]
MTDPIQGTNPPQQGQQGYTDDILGGDNIFIPIPEAMPEDDKLAYTDMLEKQYHFDPIPEVEPVQPVVAPVRQQVQQPVAPVQPVQVPVQPVKVPVAPVQQVQ